MTEEATESTSPVVESTSPIVESEQVREREPEKSGLEALKSQKPKLASAAAASVAAADSYKPNYKFVVHDKEHELEDWVKPFVKDKDSEKKVRELYEKAFGLEEIKPKFHSLKEEYNQTKIAFEQQQSALETLGGFVKGKDYESFFEALNIPKKDILEYALKVVELDQLPAEQKAQLEASKQAQREMAYYRQQNEQLQQSQQQFAVQQRVFELKNVLSSPDVAAIAEAYNTGAGKPDAFEDYVIQIGQSFAARGQDISAEQAVQEATRHLRAINPQLGIKAPTNVVATPAKPVLPNIQGRGISPVKPAVKSLEDLKRRAKELNTSY